MVVFVRDSESMKMLLIQNEQTSLIINILSKLKSKIPPYPLCLAVDVAEKRPLVTYFHRQIGFRQPPHHPLSPSWAPDERFLKITRQCLLTNSAEQVIN